LSTPCPACWQVAVIREASLPSQATWFSTLSTVDADMSAVTVPLSPCVVVVGQVVGLPATWQAVREQQQADSKGGS
jgi:siroheme synthase